LHIVLMWSQFNHFFAPCIHGYMQVVVVWSHAFLMICMAFALVLHVQAWSVVQCMVICIASIHTIYIYIIDDPLSRIIIECSSEPHI
jgi:hypothetical protein